uniref:ARAD1D16984p n=1 Tax=Blastobotrys adeninivorans TaxID=409370 RepID=A0A060T9T5_BLAAD
MAQSELAELDSAEKVTKFLRSQDSKLDDILETARALRDGSLSVYLPRKDLVIAELLLDRFSIKKNSSWRRAIESWVLLVDIIVNLDTISDIESLSRLSEGHDLIQILADSFADAQQSSQQFKSRFLALATQLLSIVSKRHSWPRLKPDVGSQLLCNYFQLSLLDVQDSEQLSPHISYVVKFFLRSVGSMAKKQTIGVASATVPCALVISAMAPDQDIPNLRALSWATIESVLPAVMGSDPGVCKELLQKARDMAINPSILGPLFERMIKASPKSLSERTEAAQNAFTAITSLFPDTIASLLDVATANKIRVKSESLEKVLEMELHQSKKPSLQVVRQILVHDADVVFKYSDDVFRCMANVGLDQSIDLFQELLQVYYNSREFTKFFDIWSNKLVPAGQLWQSSQVISAIVSILKDLSTVQLGNLCSAALATINDTNNKNSPPKKRKTSFDCSCLVPLLALVRAIFLSPKHIADSQEFLSAVLNLSKGASEPIFWEIKYLVLSIGQHWVDSFGAGCLSLIEEASLNKKSSVELWTNVMNTILRIVETDPSRAKEFQEYRDLYFGKVLPKSEESSLAPALSQITRRWLIVMELVLDNEQLKNLANLYLRVPYSLNELLANEMFYEQKRVAESVLREMASDIAVPKENLETVEAAKNINSELLSRPFRRSRDALLNVLVDGSSELRPDSKKLIEFIQAEKNLFTTSQVTSTKLDTDPKSLLDFIRRSSADPEQESLALSIAETIIRKHISTSAEGSQSQFVREVYSSLIKSLKKSNESDLKFILLIIGVAGIDEKHEKVMDSVNSFITSQKPSSLVPVLEYVLVACRNNSFSSKASSVAKSVQLLLTDALKSSADGDIALSKVCFNVLCGVVPQSHEQARQITAYYLVLSSEGTDEYYLKYLQGLDTELQDSLLGEVISESFSSAEDMPRYGSALLDLFGTLKSDQQREHLKDYFTKVVSLMSEKCALLNNSKEVVVILKLINTVLREKAWLVSQYTLELVLSLIVRFVGPRGPRQLGLDRAEEIYEELNRIISSILLMHRHRLGGRYHLLMAAFNALLACLARPTKSESRAQWLNTQLGPESAASYTRVVGNLCEPAVQSIRERAGKSNLTSSYARARQELRRHVYVLLVSYIQLSLDPQFESSVNRVLAQGFYVVFDALGSDGLRVTSSLLDHNSQEIFKVLYDDYVKNGKWKEDL